MFLYLNRCNFEEDKFVLKFSHLLKDRLVVVDVIDSHDDLGGAAERVWSSRRVVIGGGNIENVLGPSEPRRWTPPQLDDAYTQTQWFRRHYTDQQGLVIMRGSTGVQTGTIIVRFLTSARPNHA